MTREPPGGSAVDARARMVDRQIAGRGVCDPAVLRAMRAVPRERFVPRELVAYAYDDMALPIAAGQTISQPYIVAVMIAAAAVTQGDTVLEVGAGSGYAAAVVAQIAGRVIAIERHPALVDAARERIAALGYANVELRPGDGSGGLDEELAFDAILVSAAGPAIPDALRRHLAIGGRLVMPVGNRRSQRLCRLVRTGEASFDEQDLGAVVFVPLVGDHGWPADAG